LAEFLEADGAFSLVLQNFVLGVIDLARWYGDDGDDDGDDGDD
jgi:hypothetical protein